MSEKSVGVIGAGSFGTAIANILAERSDVMLYARKPEVIEQIKQTGKNKGYDMRPNVSLTNDLALLAKSCDIIFPIVPSSGFRSLMKALAPYLHPYHILIHGTKGLDLRIPEECPEDAPLNRDQVRTMSEVIKEETVVVRVGCLAGPNLAKELSDQQPGATVVASRFDEVIQEGQKLLRNERFQVYGNPDLIGIELTGVLKNIIAIASGILGGLGHGENAKGLLISRGMVEMIYLGRALGGNIQAFLGLAGVGDLVTTCNSTLSRNFTVGYRLAQGEKLTHIVETMEEVAEGINTVRIAKRFAERYQLRALITETLHKVLFEDLPANEAVDNLMRYPLTEDIDFI
ncbi:MAG: NAD(P)H-dependent glycerol-3-phosphate dehydrogenase [Bacteroidota bacterium]